MSNQPPQAPKGWGPQPGQQPPQPPQWPQSPPQGQGWQPPQGPQPPAWGQRGYQPPPPKPKPPIYQRSWFLIVAIIGGVMALGAVGSLFGDPSAEDTSGSGVQTEERQAEEAETAPTEATPGIGDAARDGNFEFVVTAFRCSAGQCRANLRVENIGSDPGTMFASNQYLFDDQGRRFEADDSLTDPLSLQELNPGQTVSGKIIWRVAGTINADHLELHDSAFSGGVEVKV